MSQRNDRGQELIVGLPGLTSHSRNGPYVPALAEPVGKSNNDLLTQLGLPARPARSQANVNALARQREREEPRAPRLVNRPLEPPRHSYRPLLTRPRRRLSPSSSSASGALAPPPLPPPRGPPPSS